MLTQNRKIMPIVTLLAVAVAVAIPEFEQKSRADELKPAQAGAADQSSWDAVTLGRVEPRSGEVKIAAPAPGRIADVLVQANEEVFAGQLLVRLDDEEALARVAEADAQVALHKRARNDQSSSSTTAERRKAEDAAADSERAVADAQAALDKLTAQWRAGSASKPDLDGARSTLSKTQSRLHDQQDALAKLKSATDTPLPTRLEGELNVAQAELTLARAALEETRIRAPIDGVALRVDAKKGEIAVPSPQPSMLVIGDLSGLRVRAEVDEQHLGKIRVGERVRIRAAAFLDREFHGKVSSIARIIGQSRINSGDPRRFNDVNVMDVVVDLPDPGPLVVGEQVDVYFKADPSESQ